MWQAMLRTGALIALVPVLSGCSVDENATDEGQAKVTVSVDMPSDPLFISIGTLPPSNTLEQIVDIEAKVQQILLSGLDDTYFKDDIFDQTDAIQSLGTGQVETWRMTGNKRIPFLVVRRLKPLTNAQLAGDFCQSGQVYSGYVAARNFLYSKSSTESTRIVKAHPYGLLACEQSGDVSIKLVSSNHEIFEGETLPDIPDI